MAGGELRLTEMGCDYARGSGKGDLRSDQRPTPTAELGPELYWTCNDPYTEK